ncbi:MAG: hypothetical protein AAGN64_02220 [Bacteroidota bacterium]
MQLRGVPRLNGIERPRASIETPVSDEWQEVTRTIEIGQVRRIERLGTRRWRGRWSVGYAALTRGEALALRSDLEADTLLWCPRTRIAGDPDWLDETEVEVYLDTALSTLEPLWRDDQAAWTMEFELVSVETLTSKPNTFQGGFYDRGETATTYTVEPYQDGSITERVETRTFLGQNYDVTILAFGSEGVAAMRLAYSATREDALLITTTAPPPNPTS